jgi:transcriptional regulator with XRE-family HTH domain
MSYGYSARFIKLNKDANPEFLGVRLGRVCIDKNVSVIEVARELKVTRQTVYNWFSGATAPLPALAPAVELYLSSLG